MRPLGTYLKQIEEHQKPPKIFLLARVLVAILD